MISEPPELRETEACSVQSSHIGIFFSPLQRQQYEVRKLWPKDPGSFIRLTKGKPRVPAAVAADPQALALLTVEIQAHKAAGWWRILGCNLAK